MISFSCHVLLTVHCQMPSPELRKSAFQASRACGSWGCGRILQAKTGWIEACLPCSPSREVAAEKEVNRGEGSIGETCRNPKMLIVFFLNVGDVIVTTPHSLLRLLTYRSLLFLRLCHLVLDEVQVLFFEANEQVSMDTLGATAIHYNSLCVSEMCRLFRA